VRSGTIKKRESIVPEIIKKRLESYPGWSDLDFEKKRAYWFSPISPNLKSPNPNSPNLISPNLFPLVQIMISFLYNNKKIPQNGQNNIEVFVLVKLIN